MKDSYKTIATLQDCQDKSKSLVKLKRILALRRRHVKKKKTGNKTSPVDGRPNADLVVKMHFDDCNDLEAEEHFCGNERVAPTS